jgi:Ca2+-binding EF-hand superfamily protein
MFDTFDNDGSGILNLEELNKILKKLDVESSTPHLKEKLEEL